MSSNLVGDKYQLTVGLEIHAELKTRTKMFCDSANDPNEKRPNVNICPICLAHPGTLPTINQKAIEHVLRVGLAVGGTLADYTEFDRKHYFYPDIPKGYQISQYQYPLVTGGSIQGIKLTRIHLEEDTARSIHDDKGGGSLIDFNRAGVPLMELVTEPMITSAKQAGDFAREWQLLLRYLDVSSANMEKGEMRVEANISIQRSDLKNPKRSDLGGKVEVKNLNSFKSVEQAIEYELKRQTALLEVGGKVIQETRGWDEVKGVTFSQRLKESSHDYRYFPDPDLPKLWLSEIPEFHPPAGGLQSTIPELPWVKRDRYRALGLKLIEAEQYLNNFELAKFFDEAAVELKDPELVKIASNFIANDIAGRRKVNPDWPLPTLQRFTEVVRLYHSGKLASPQAKNSILTGVLVEMSTADALAGLVEKIVSDNPKVVADYRAGKVASLQFLIGQGMRLSKGSANPTVLEKLIKQTLQS
ncbi:MAG: Asp-tRNA(Asn)/Glu-tRNA(Gln) amidotransferase subunit GatB [Patescibacteria group bacterium]